MFAYESITMFQDTFHFLEGVFFYGSDSVCSVINQYIKIHILTICLSFLPRE